MSSFILHRKGSEANTEGMLKIMQQKGLGTPEQFSAGGYTLYLYQRILVKTRDYIIQNDLSMFVCGSVCYKGLSYNDTLTHIYNDYKTGSLDRSKLQGVFCVLFVQDQNIQILTDQSGIQNIFYTADGSLISSSFLAITEGYPGKLTLNRLSIAETLTTGLQIGPDTNFNEIRRYEFIAAPALPQISWLNKPNDTRAVASFKGSYKDAVASQVKVLTDYVKNLRKMSDEFGVDSGITGGHDSRLLLVAIKDTLSRTSFHSHWRKVMDQELACAKLVCEKAGLPITIHEIKHPVDMTEKEAEQTYEEGLLCYDGLVRMYCYFYESYNGFAYRTSVLGNNRIGLNGIGGEQYRNDEHMLFSWDTKNWIRYQLIRYECGDAFKTKAFEEELNDYVLRKISAKLLWTNKKKISKPDLKRYQNEVFVPARMGARNNAENQLSFFFSPYTDAIVSQEAYKIAARYLGLSFDFEEDMIAQINPEIAGVMSDYGFNFIDKEPLKRRVQHFIKAYLPFSYKAELLNKRFLARGNEMSRSLRKNFKIHNDAFERVASLGLPLDLDRISYQPDLMGVTLSMGYLLNKYQHKISF